MFRFRLWPLTKRRKLERDKAEALKALNAAERRLEQERSYLSGIQQCKVWHDADDKTESETNAKRHAFKQMNEARRTYNAAARKHLAALDALNNYLGKKNAR